MKQLKRKLHLNFIKIKLKNFPRFQDGMVKFGKYKIRYTDSASLYIELKDIFYHEIYHFESDSLSPVIIDGGSCIGVSVLYFKTIYPDARILCFEPDPRIFSILQQNIEKNNLQGITLFNAGLAAYKGTSYFEPDAMDGGKIVKQSEQSLEIKTVMLSRFITESIDFLKLNIEGQELPVLQELENSGSIRNIKKMVIEYHGWAGGEQKLGDLLTLLERNHFRYLVHDFDAETCSTSKPPFHINQKNPWFCLIYAERSE